MLESSDTRGAETIPPRYFYRLLLATGVLFALFSYSTELSDLALGSARDPERWARWRYGIVSGWLALAAGLFEARSRRAYLASLRAAAVTGALVALLLAGIWVEMAGQSWIYLSALCYVAIAVLLTLSLRRAALAALLAGLLIPVQVLVDWVVLGAAGSFRIH